MVLNLGKNVNNTGIKVSLPILGRMAKDVVSGYSGIITHVQFTLDNNILIVLTSDIQATASCYSDGSWFPINRIVLIGEDNVLDTCRTLKNEFELNIFKEGELDE